MKKIMGLIMIIGVFMLMGATMSSCSRKTGCPSTENATIKGGKKGLPTKRGNSNLFPKKMRKRKN